MTALQLSVKERFVRGVLGVTPGDCQEHVNRMRADIGISHWQLERALLEQHIRRAGWALTLPLPRGRFWTAAGFLFDVGSAGRDYAGLAASMAYVHDPAFFERTAWPHELLRIMVPLEHPPKSVGRQVGLMTAGVAAAAAARSTLRRLGHAGARSFVGGALRSLALAQLWARAESALAARAVFRGLRLHDAAHGFGR
jgi:hypothetical protein